ncbi:MAG: 2-hydroxyglutaryl-CoA dehydratase [Planctomycetota bacterium]|nr:MAG: 2-hydroxyglutaryl-CoA dehydratase [Planctomycetota bacterium]
MNFVAGIDVGSRMTKAVLLAAEEDGGILGRGKVYTHFDLNGAAERALEAALAEADVARDRVDYIAATGYGRYQVGARDIQITEITCHARGAVELIPDLVTLLDVGAQNARAIRLLPNGRVVSFRMNDKCASGAGRFIERVAGALEVDLGQVGPLAMTATEPCPISSICAVLAESEVINHVTNGETIPDILQGTHESIVDRLASLVRQVNLEPPFGLTGGVANNRALVHALEQRLEMPVRLHRDSEYAGALGAALLGRRRRRQLRTASAVA